MLPRSRPSRIRPALTGVGSVAPLLVLVALSARAAAQEDVQGAIKSAMDSGARFLQTAQNPDGGYGPYGDFRIEAASDVGITAFVLNALVLHPRRYVEADGPFISRAVDFLLSKQQADGAFYDLRDPTLKNYKTSVCIMALSNLNPTRYSAQLKRAEGFVRAQQMDETLQYDADAHVAFGGYGYGSGLRPDLSNSQFSLDAMAAMGVSPSDELWKKAVVFASRCLNTEEVDPLLRELGVGTSGDGGARYGPNITRGPSETLDDGTTVFSSYGSMSYAAFKAFLYANVDQSDSRVAGLIDWIGNNWTLRENPGMATPTNPAAGKHGLFYYYHTMSKALALLGQPTIEDSKGIEHRWAAELGTHLVRLQKDDGSWLNESDRWWENLPALDTAYALISLRECLDQLASEAKAPKPEKPEKPEPAAEEDAEEEEAEES